MSVLHFRVDDEGNIINVSYDSSTTARNFMLDFLNKHTNYATLDKEVYTFQCNGKILNSNKYIDIKIKELIRENGLVRLFKKQNIY